MHVERIRGQRLEEYLYRPAPGLWAITAYYNPAGYRSRRRNYETFARLLRLSGVPLLTVECAFADQPYDLPESLDVVRVRSASLLWQKERLLNLAISWLPPTCEAVAWLDCDLVFANPDWARDTLTALTTTPVVQVFETCDRLPADPSATDCPQDLCESFASVVRRDPATLHTGRYLDHGHSGYGWAARRDLLDRHRLYEFAISGSSDHYMAHAAVGDFDAECLQRMTMRDPVQMAHFRDWAAAFHASMGGGGLGVVPGTALHLWHGDLADRKYALRHVEFSSFRFDPYRDVVAPPGKPLEFAPDLRNDALKEWFRSYFPSRREDGPHSATMAAE